MYIREYRRDDIPVASSIFADAFIDDEFFAFMAPYRYEYPLAWRSSATEKQHEAFVRPGTWGLVCVSDGLDGKGAKDEILGYAWWTRKVSKDAIGKDKYMLNNDSVSATTERLLRSVERKYRSWFCPNAATCHSARPILDRAASEANVWGPLEKVTHWHLSALAVAPQHQRKGVGKILVNWGVQKAMEESAAAPDLPPVPVTLVASVNGRGLYTQLGFRVIGWKVGILAEWGRAMIYDPGLHGKELQQIYDRVTQEERPTGGGSCMVFESRGYWIEEMGDETLVAGRPVEAVWSSNAVSKTLG